ncbi:MAG: hypothetical protein CAPSK01_001267 [Candidatus Accumulibacter vicinus]|uniref:Uncharacterized protein n=1 Tax=Candidatus Accumulibacter vicinus TaxID=2954382 RepID=A0A084Y2Y2_9PROT|nr:MAG: hypothetical protein CAPSK01_001267 [Candidatus Accumulibacter vicinus]
MNVSRRSASGASSMMAFRISISAGSPTAGQESAGQAASGGSSPVAGRKPASPQTVSTPAIRSTSLSVSEEALAWRNRAPIAPSTAGRTIARRSVPSSVCVANCWSSPFIRPSTVG